MSADKNAKQPAKDVAPSKELAKNPEAPKDLVKKEQTPPAESKARKINVHHLTRVEGHGNIVVEIDALGAVKQCRWEVPEAPRFFEAMILERSFADVH